MSLGERLREVRVRHTVSEEGLALKVGLSAGDVADVEAGLEVPSYEALKEWAQVLEIPFYKLFFSSPEAVRTPRLTPRFTLEDPARPQRSGVVSFLFDRLPHAVFTLLSREKVPEEKSGS